MQNMYVIMVGDIIQVRLRKDTYTTQKIQKIYLRDEAQPVGSPDRQKEVNEVEKTLAHLCTFDLGERLVFAPDIVMHARDNDPITKNPFV